MKTTNAISQLNSTSATSATSATSTTSTTSTASTSNTTSTANKLGMSPIYQERKISLKNRMQNLWHTISILLINEVRLRARRLSTLFALLLMVAISWSMIPDPQTGMVMMALDDARVAYTSSALAFGSAAQASMLLSLISFYLLRGRMSEDVRTGMGSIIATTSIKNSVFIVSRWLGAVAYILMLMFAFVAVILVLHIVRGEGAIQVHIYLVTYLLFFIPMAFATASIVILFDSVPFLMGKVGDILYFILWLSQISWVGASVASNGIVGNSSLSLLFDFSGFGAMVSIFKFHLQTTSFSLGYAEFNAALAPIVLPDFLWTFKIILMRLLSALIAMTPLLIAIPLFHRFSPDKVKAGHTRNRRSPIAILNLWSRPLAKQAHPLFTMASRMPNLIGQVLADLALSIVSAPFIVVLLVVFSILQATLPAELLPRLAIIAIAIWGILVSDTSTRDYQAGIEDMTGTVQGGAAQRYLRQYCASCLLGFLFVAPLWMRWSYTKPTLAIALLVGILTLSAIASLLGRCSRTPRTFLSIFLIWLYIATQTPKVSELDMVGFNGAATMMSMSIHACIAVACVLLGYTYTQWKARDNT